MKMRVNLLGETTSGGSKPHIRALSETKAIATGANFISESFLFVVAVSLIMAESFRGYRKESKRRDVVSDRLESLEKALYARYKHETKDQQMMYTFHCSEQSHASQRTLVERIQHGQDQNQAVLRILDGVVDIGMRSGEMRRILSQDPVIIKALKTMQDDLHVSQQTETEATEASTSTKSDRMPDEHSPLLGTSIR